MGYPETRTDGSYAVRIPADVDREDRVLASLTARQLAILTMAGLVLYTAWAVTRVFVPTAVFLALATPVGVGAAFLALGQRDGISLDRLLIAAIRQRMSPRHRVAAPEGVQPPPEWLTTPTNPHRRTRAHRAQDTVPGAGRVSPSPLQLPAQAVTDTGVIDLGKDGLAVVAVASTVNFALRTPAEQEALVASFGRYLHSLTAPVQVLVRTERLDISSQITELRERAGGLPHPALESAAVEHADYLAQLGEQTDLLRRQVLLVLHEPITSAGATDGLGGPCPLAVLATLVRGRRHATTQTGRASAAMRRAAESRLVRRLGEAIELLAPAGIVVTALDAGQATAVLASACNPDNMLPPSTALAGADEVITTGGANDQPTNSTFRQPAPRAYIDMASDLDEHAPDIGGWDDEDDSHYFGYDYGERSRW